MPIIDHNLHVMTTSAIYTMSTDTHAHINNLNGMGGKGLALHVVTSPNGTGVPLMTINVYGSTTSAAATTDVIIASRSGLTKNAAYVIPFFGNSRSVCFEFITTSSTTAVFSKIQMDVTENVGNDWTRGVEFR